MNGYHIHVAGPFHKCFFKVLAKYVTRTPEVYGGYFPWGIFVLYDYRHKVWLLRHEVAHAKQRARDGFFKYWIRTFFYIWKYGYQNSPYEIEARKAQNVDAD